MPQIDKKDDNGFQIIVDRIGLSKTKWKPLICNSRRTESSMIRDCAPILHRHKMRCSRWSCRDRGARALSLQPGTPQAQNEIIKLRSESAFAKYPTARFAWNSSKAAQWNRGWEFAKNRHCIQGFVREFFGWRGWPNPPGANFRDLNASMQTISDSKAGVKGYFSLDSANMIKYEKRLLSDIEQIDWPG